MSNGKPSLESAYALETSDDSRRLYRDWALDYDSSFAESLGYALPRRVAEVYRDVAGPDDGPILDIGAGTGLLGAALAGTGHAIDGVDISSEMLGRAADKRAYRALIEADLTAPLDLPDAAYGGLVSSGTFTHGHVGPEALPELFRVARPGALFVLAINVQVYDGRGFGSAFARAVAEEQIGPLDFREVRIYERDDHEHGQDTGLITLFRRR